MVDNPRYRIRETGMRPWLRVGIAASLLGGFHGLHAADYMSVLPEAAQAHAALDQSPQIRIARARVDIGAAQRRRIKAGAGEWAVSVLNDQRTDGLGEKFQEQEYSLSRQLRWPNKYLLDQHIGDATTEVAEYAFEDAWHEAGRSLLASWFNCLRTRSEAQLLNQQVTVLEQQLAAVSKRVSAGDAPALEQSQAQAELERIKVLHNQAEQAARSAVLLLQQDFPDIRAPGASLTLATPEPLQGTDEEWLARILGANHEIKLAEGEAMLARLQADRAGQDRLGDPTVGLRYTDNKDGNRKQVGVSVTLPLGSTARRSDYAIARSTSAIAEQNARAARLKVESDGRHDLLNTRISYSQWQRLQSINNQSTRNAELVQRGYSLGEFTYSELQIARRQALEAASSEQSAQLSALEANARLLVDAHMLWTPEEDETGHNK